MTRTVRIALFAVLSSLVLGISAAHAADHETATQASWDRGEGEHWSEHRDEHRDRRFSWEQREEQRREELRREWLWRHRFDDDGFWRR